MHCPECGFVNAEGANYCQRCGAFLGEAESGKAGDTTEVYQVDETGELRAVDLDQVTHEGATIVIRSGGGRSGEAFTLSGERMTIGFIAWSDQLDGMVARITGQYSRLGALLDPLTDRLLVIAGAIVAWEFELLPRWALLVLAAREAFMLLLTQVALRRGMDLSVNMLGRWAVWPVMGALGLAMIVETWVSAALLYLGLVMTLAATAVYLQDGWRALREGSTST